MYHSTGDCVLDVQFVEGIHSLGLLGQSARISELVSKIDKATLAGLVEFLCLQHAFGKHPQIPQSPARLLQSPVATALSSVICPFGLRNTGRFVPHRDFDPRPIEFYCL